jgi:dihydrofolate reductase
MSRIVVVNHLTLDGVMQAPAGADEDTRDGFEHGGWAAANQDEVMGRVLGQGMAGGPGLLLFGRRTYEHMYSYWPKQTDDNPFTEILNRSQKFVASRTLCSPLPWENSTLLEGDAGDAVAALKAQHEKDMVVLGSGDLFQTLIERDLVDEYLLMIHPVVLGTGRRMFRDGGASSKLLLVESVTTTTGVVIARYHSAD